MFFVHLGLEDPSDMKALFGSESPGQCEHVFLKVCLLIASEIRQANGRCIPHGLHCFVDVTLRVVGGTIHAGQVAELFEEAELWAVAMAADMLCAPMACDGSVEKKEESGVSVAEVAGRVAEASYRALNRRRSIHV